MTPFKDENRKHFVISFIYYVIIFLIIWFIFKYLIGLILPFLLGYFIAALLQPVVRFLNKRMKFKRRAAGVLTVILFTLVFGLLITLCITKIIGELIAVFGMIPDIFEKLSVSLYHLTGSYSRYIDSLPDGFANRLTQALQSLSAEITKLSSLSSGIVSFIMNMVVFVPGLLFDIIITIISACFISMDYGTIRGFVLRQLPMKYQNWACDIKEFFFITVAKLLRAYFTLMIITFVELAVGLTLLRIPHSVSVAAVISVVDILPVLGTGSVLIPWVLIELILGNVYLAAGLGALYAVIMVVRNILEPKIVGHHIGLYPLVTLLAMFIGLKLLGVVGMFLFPITVIIIKHMHDTGKIRLWKD